MEMGTWYVARTNRGAQRLKVGAQQFHDALLRSAHEGGIRAARLLLREIQDFVGLRDVRTKEWNVMVQIYAGYKGLSGDLVKCGITRQRSDFQSFTAGFIRYQDLFDFPDIGTGSERASHKIKGRSSLLQWALVL